MAKFFVRTDKEVIEDACNLSLEEFVLKYKQQTGEEQLSKAYLSIRKENKITEVQTTVKVGTAPKVFSKVLTSIKKEFVGNSVDVEDDLVDVEELVPIEIEESPLETEFVPVKKNVKKSVVSDKKQKIINRDARIKELLLKGVKPKEIVIQMAEEGYTVHTPQISAVNKTIK